MLGIRVLGILGILGTLGTLVTSGISEIWAFRGLKWCRFSLVFRRIFYALTFLGSCVCVLGLPFFRVYSLF